MAVGEIEVPVEVGCLPQGGDAAGEKERPTTLSRGWPSLCPATPLGSGFLRLFSALGAYSHNKVASIRGKAFWAARNTSVSRRHVLGERISPCDPLPPCAWGCAVTRQWERRWRPRYYLGGIKKLCAADRVPQYGANLDCYRYRPAVEIGQP